jgi:hypothetical protein
VTRDHRATHHDALSEFASEPVPPPASSELDALIDAASAGALAAFPSEADNQPAAAGTNANDRWRWTVGVSMQPITVRWVAAPLAAFVVGAVLVAWGLRTIEPSAPSIARATPPSEVSGTSSPAIDVAQPTTSFAAIATTQEAVAPTQSPTVETPANETGNTVAPSADVTPSAVGVQAATVIARNEPPTAPTPVREAVPAPLRASASTPVRAAGPVTLPSAARAALPRTIAEPVPPAPAPLGFDPRAVLPSTIAEPPPIAAPASKPVEIAAVELPRTAATAPPAAPAVVEEQAVRETLDHYADAFAGMDVQATAAVWPSVDRRALTRAFATLKSQGLTFNSCNINVNDVSATAHCRGTVKFVRKIGNPTPLTAPQEWRFVMRKLGATWTIDEVTATRDSISSAQFRSES